MAAVQMRDNISADLIDDPRLLVLCIDSQTYKYRPPYASFLELDLCMAAASFANSDEVGHVFLEEILCLNLEILFYQLP